MEEVSGVYTSPLLDTDGLKMALRARKVSGAFEKRASAGLLRNCECCAKNGTVSSNNSNETGAKTSS